MKISDIEEKKKMYVRLYNVSRKIAKTISDIKNVWLDFNFICWTLSWSIPQNEQFAQVLPWLQTSYHASVLLLIVGWI